MCPLALPVLLCFVTACPTATSQSHQSQPPVTATSHSHHAHPSVTATSDSHQPLSPVTATSSSPRVRTGSLQVLAEGTRRASSSIGGTGGGAVATAKGPRRISARMLKSRGVTLTCDQETPFSPTFRSGQ